MYAINQLLESASEAQLAGNTQAALEQYKRVLLLHPNELNLQIICGNLCVELGQFEEAAGHFRRILAFNKNPDVRSALCFALQALGNEAHGKGNFKLAEACFQEVIEHQPNNAVYWYNLGNALRELGHTQNALNSFTQSIKLNPTDADTHNNLGNVQRELGQLDKAIASYEKALTLNPSLHHALVHLVHQKQHTCDWRELDSQIAMIRNCVINVPEAKVSPFAFLSMPNTTASEQEICANHYVSQNYAQLISMRPLTYLNNHKIRLGYLSADFRLHPLAFLITEVIENHDKNQFETYAYSYGLNDKTTARKRLEQAFDHFLDIRDLSEIDAAKKIHTDQIDILIDLTGFTQSSRTGIIAIKPAQITINWLGYPGTMGSILNKNNKLPLFDWIIADKIIAPNSENISEEILYLPCYQPNSKRPVGNITKKSEHGLPENVFVFCSFNQTFKITEEIFLIWMRLLAQVPNSVLWLMECNNWAKINLKQKAETAGINSNRLIFAPRAPIEMHLERQTHADLFLDTLPYNAHTTASDALYMGLPVLTIMGNTFPARVSTSLLSSIGLPELSCLDSNIYEEKALFLARNPKELAIIKEKLINHKESSDLFNSEKFARNLEAQLKSIWRAHQLETGISTYACDKVKNK
jgi:predicted O-linked N-acetylglucosamine transferase (SPINDLY family)